MCRCSLAHLHDQVARLLSDSLAGRVGGHTACAAADRNRPVVGIRIGTCGIDSVNVIVPQSV